MALNLLMLALQALHAAQVKSGQRVLIHGGNGGIGSVAVQISKAWGCHVTTTCSTKNQEFVKVSTAHAHIRMSGIHKAVQYAPSIAGRLSCAYTDAVK